MAKAKCNTALYRQEIKPLPLEGKQAPTEMFGKKAMLRAIAAVVAIRLKEDEERPAGTETNPEAFSLYRVLTSS